MSLIKRRGIYFKENIKKDNDRKIPLVKQVLTQVNF